MTSRIIFFLVYQFLFLFWCFKLHSHFFEFTIADQTSLTLAMLAPLAFLRINPKIKIKFLWIPIVVLPLILLPTLQYSIGSFSDTWLILYLFLILTGSAILLNKALKPLLLGFLSISLVWFIPFSLNPNQLKYYDFLNKTISTRIGETDLVNWKGEQWIYINNSLYLSTVDGHMHTETLVHTSLPFFSNPTVLLVGDDFGMTRNEIHKYDCTVDHLPYDAELLAKSEVSAQATEMIHSDIIPFLENASKDYDVIIVDLPDPEHLPFKPFYGDYFYELCFNTLAENGILVTNAGGFYTNEKHFEKIESTLHDHGLETELLQALIPTLGHRTWIMASQDDIDLDMIKIKVPTQWINEDAIHLMRSPGKKSYPF